MRSERRSRCGMLRDAAVCLLWMTGALETANAGGPRWVTGPPYFTTPGQAVVWYTNSPLYYTDPGDLGPGVNHAAADAIVAAAAAVWNVPTASLVLGQGGSLDEHVSAQNVFASPQGLIFPTDVQPTASATKQIAVVYDADGSVTDLLLGAGASDPSGCRQNAVTESVDSITPDGLIRHAMLVLNGRCAGPSTEQKLQMQYQVMRAFGRVLGLAWSQTNDNVFTYAPQPTYQQAMHWPVMHPIDIICGPYTYQCMPEPFTLRPDDVSALGQLYFIARGTAPPGKTDTQNYANGLGGRLLFPNGQGMQGVNVEAKRWQQYNPNPEDWYEASSVTGFDYRLANGNPIEATDSSMSGSFGTLDGNHEGWYRIARIPIISGDWQNVYLDTEPVNPLYTGEYAVGPYPGNTVTPSGTNSRALAYVLGSYLDATWVDISTAGAAGVCGTASDGTETALAALSASGWWTGTLCGYGHTAWTSFAVQAGRTFTLEVTAEDEMGNATAQKAMPVIGVWNASDATGIMPTVAAVASSFNSSVTGLTSLQVNSSQAGTLRMVIADGRGDGRPDYRYQARVLYADSVAPQNLQAAGGIIAITGIGFREGDAVLVNGEQAQVQSWSPTQIVAIAPPSRSFGTGAAVAADVMVEDLTSGGVAAIPGGLAYRAAPAEEVRLLSAPSGTMMAGTGAVTPFAVQVLQMDGVTPVAGEDVVFSASGGGVRFGACGAGSCAVTTDSMGRASTTVTVGIAGVVELSAVTNAGTISAAFVATAPPPDVMVAVSAPAGVMYAGDVATVPFAVRITQADGITPVAGMEVVFTSSVLSEGVYSSGGVLYGACASPSCTVVTDSAGVASLSVTSSVAGAVTLKATAAGVATATFTAVARVRSVALVQPVQYIAAGSVVDWQPAVTVTDNSTAVSGLPVLWNVTSGTMSLAAPASSVSANGEAQMMVIAGPIASGQQASGRACVWGAVCATFTSQSVQSSSLQVEVVNGTVQPVTSGGSLGTVILRVTDGAGHGVAGAVVTVYQAVTGPEVFCSGKGRCPSAPIYETAQTLAFSDLQGLVSVFPLQLSGVAETTNIAASVGTGGFISLALPVP